MATQKFEKIIDHYSLKLSSLLGKGAFSEVYLGEDLLTQKEVAIKVLPLKLMKENQLKLFLTREVPIMKGLCHPNIIKTHDTLMSKNHVYVIIEYCNQGDLEALMKKKGKFTECEVKQILIDILAGMKELRRLNIMHRDIKPANIFNHNGVYKIGDFGFAKVVNSQNDVKNSCVGTPLYMSPQCLQNSGYSNKNDIWSLGILIYELLFGETPWENCNYYQLLATLNSTSFKFPKKNDLSKSMKKLIKKCLKIKENDR